MHDRYMQQSCSLSLNNGRPSHLIQKLQTLVSVGIEFLKEETFVNILVYWYGLFNGCSSPQNVLFVLLRKPTNSMSWYHLSSYMKVGTLLVFVQLLQGFFWAVLQPGWLVTCWNTLSTYAHAHTHTFIWIHFYMTFFCQKFPVSSCFRWCCFG